MWGRHRVPCCEKNDWGLSGFSPPKDSHGCTSFGSSNPFSLIALMVDPVDAGANRARTNLQVFPQPAYVRNPVDYVSNCDGVGSTLTSERRLRVVYVFTTFPLLTETPSQRELRVLDGLPIDVEVYSIWGGLREFDGRAIRLFNKWRLASLLWLLPYWIVRKPRVFWRLVRRLSSTPMPSLLNAGETLLGIAFAVCYAAHFCRPANRPDLIHGVWATLPATAAQLLWELTGIPFSMGAHAYDVFRHDGDWDLASKLNNASRIITSSDSTRRRLLDRGADPKRTILVRRGLDILPPKRAPRSPRSPLRILAVGRLIEKKGYEEQLEVYAALKSEGVAFHAKIVGAGPLERTLRRRIGSLGLSEHVTLTGPLPYAAVLEQYAWADVLLFTGKVARSGDQDGLPNVIPEAMANGVPVITRAVAGASEAMTNGCTGILIASGGTGPWVVALRRLQHDDCFYRDITARARSWVETHYDARENSRDLFGHFKAAASSVAVGCP